MIYLKKSKRNITRIIFHHFGEQPPPGMNVPKIRRMHIDDRKWDDIGYHGIIMPDGEFSIGRDVNTTGAHTFKHNRGSIGIMFMAGLGRDGVTRPNKKQLATAHKIIEEQKRYYNRLEVLGHRDLRPTLCPGFDIKHWYQTNEVRK